MRPRRGRLTQMRSGRKERGGRPIAAAGRLEKPRRGWVGWEGSGMEWNGMEGEGGAALSLRLRMRAARAIGPASHESREGESGSGGAAAAGGAKSPACPGNSGPKGAGGAARPPPKPPTGAPCGRAP